MATGRGEDMYDIGDSDLDVIPIVTNIWETYITIRLQKFSLGKDFQRYHVVVTGEDYKFDLYLDKANIEFRVQDLKPGQDYKILVRGLNRETDSWTSFFSKPITSARKLQVQQNTVYEHLLDVSWAHGVSSDQLATVHQYELHIHTKEYVLTSPVLDTFLPAVEGQNAVLVGEETFKLSRELKPNRCYFVKMRAQTIIGEWGEWSDVVRFLTLKNAVIVPDEVGDSFISVKWARAKSNVHPDPEFTDADTLIKSMHIRVWEAGVRQGGLKVMQNGEQRAWFRSDEFLTEAAPCSSNQSRVTGLRPDTTYLMRVAYLNTVGVWTKAIFYRFDSLPTISINAVLRLGSDFAEVSYLREKPRAKNRDPHEDDYDDGEDESFNPQQPKSKKGRMITWNDINSSQYTSSTKFGIRAVDVSNGAVRSIEVSSATTSIVPDLEAGKTYVLSVRSLVHGDWSGWSRTVVITTLQKITMKIHRRSHDSVSIKWGRPRPLAVLFLDDNPLQDNAAGEGDMIQIPNYHTKPVRVAQSRPVQDSEIHEGIQQVVVELRRLSEGEMPFSTLTKKFTTGTGNLEFTHLSPSTMYELCIKIQNEFNEWEEGNKVVVTTLSDLVESVEDENDLQGGDDNGIAALLDIEEVKQAVEGVQQSTMELNVDEAGEGYAALSWRLIDDESLGIKSAKTVLDYFEKEKKSILVEYKILLELIKPSTDQDKEVSVLTSGKVGIAPDEVKEIYFRSTTNSTRLSNLLVDTTYRVSICRYYNKSQSWGSYSAPITFATPRGISLSVHSIESDGVMLKWRRSSPITLGSFDIQMVPTIVTAYQIQVTDAFNSDSPPISYMVEDYVPGGTSIPTQFKISNLSLSKSYAIQVRPQYLGGKLWGALSNALYISFDTILFRVYSIGEDTVHLKWDSRKLFQDNPSEKDGGSVSDKIVLSVKQVSGEWSGHIEIPRDSTSYRIARLHPKTSYNIQMTAVQLVPHASLQKLKRKQQYVRSVMKQLTAKENGDTSPGVDDLTAHWQGVFTADGAYVRNVSTIDTVQLRLLANGEDYIAVSWLKKVTNPEEDEDIFTSKITDKPPAGNREDFMRWKIDRERRLQRRAHAGTGYELKVTDESTGQISVVSVSPSNQAQLISKRVAGLFSDNRYSLSVRQRLTDQMWGLWSTPLRTTTNRRLEIEATSVGDNCISVKWSRPARTFIQGELTVKGSPVEGLLDPESQVLSIEAPKKFKVSVRAVGTFAARKTWNASLLLGSKKTEAIHKMKASSAPQEFEFEVENAESLDIADLTCSTHYAVAVRQLSYDGVWGGWSGSITTHTTPPLDVGLAAIGEGYAEVVWARRQNTLQYETVDIKGRVDYDDEAWIEKHSIVNEMQFMACNLNGDIVFNEVSGLQSLNKNRKRVTGLQSNTEYAVRVRARYGPTWGVWSDVLSLKTLPSICIAVSNIGEDSIEVNWTREIEIPEEPDVVFHSLDAPLIANARPPPVLGPREVSVMAKEADNRAANKLSELAFWEVTVEQATMAAFGVIEPTKLIANAEQSIMLIPHLEPDTLYRIRIRSCDSNSVWSPHSQSIFVSTLPLLDVCVHNVGDSFAYVSWKRAPCSFLQNVTFVDESNISIVTETGKDLKYELCTFNVVKGSSDEDVDSVDLQPTASTRSLDESRKPWTRRVIVDGDQNTFAILKLSPGTTYGVLVRAMHCYKSTVKQQMSDSAFGVYSPKVYFQTFIVPDPMPVVIGQDTIQLQWLPLHPKEPPRSTASTNEAMGKNYPLISIPVRYKVIAEQVEVPVIDEPTQYNAFHTYADLQKTERVISAIANVPSAFNVPAKITCCLGGLRPLSTYDVSVICYYKCILGREVEEEGAHVVVRCTTMPPVKASVVQIKETAVHFELRVPLLQDKRLEQSIYGSTQGWMKPIREYDIKIEGSMQSVVRINAAAMAHADVEVGNLSKDCEYKMQIRERPDASFGQLIDFQAGWCPLFTFYTLPYAPLPGELVECMEKRMRFTWGVQLGNNPHHHLFGEQVPNDMIFCVEFKLKSGTHNQPHFEQLEEGGATQQWQVAALQDHPSITMQLEHTISNYYFRVKAAKHFVATPDGRRAPLWGPYSPVMSWKEPPIPQSIHGLHVAYVSGSSAVLLWDKCENSAFQPGLVYEVYVCELSIGADRSWKHVAAVNIARVEVVDLNPNTTYRVALRCTSNFGRCKKPAMCTLTTHNSAPKPAGEGGNAVLEKLAVQIEADANRQKKKRPVGIKKKKPGEQDEEGEVKATGLRPILGEGKNQSGQAKESTSIWQKNRYGRVSSAPHNKTDSSTSKQPNSDTDIPEIDTRDTKRKTVRGRRDPPLSASSKRKALSRPHTALGIVRPADTPEKDNSSIPAVSPPNSSLPAMLSPTGTFSQFAQPLFYHDNSPTADRSPTTNLDSSLQKLAAPLQSFGPSTVGFPELYNHNIPNKKKKPREDHLTLAPLE